MLIVVLLCHDISYRLRSDRQSLVSSGYEQDRLRTLLRPSPSGTNHLWQINGPSYRCQLRPW
jgi:hypothetical protein